MITELLSKTDLFEDDSQITMIICIRFLVGPVPTHIRIQDSKSFFAHNDRDTNFGTEKNCF